MTQQRRRFPAQDKAAILRRHFIDKVAVSDLCDENHLNPTLFYRWQKEFFENGAAAFERDDGSEVRRLEERVAALHCGDLFLEYSRYAQEGVAVRPSAGT